MFLSVHSTGGPDRETEIQKQICSFFINAVEIAIENTESSTALF